MSTPNLRGDLNLGHVFDAAGLSPVSISVLRHTFTKGGLESPLDLTPENVLAYTRSQSIDNKVPKVPGSLWLCFMADGKRRSRLRWAFENHGEVLSERTSTLRFFGLRPSEALASLMDRLVVEWSGDSVNWHKTGLKAAPFPVVEIADPHAVPFPGFDRVRLPYSELQSMTTDSQYATWRTALSTVQAIYLIADTSTGRLYVGKADGSERLLGRWTSYARDGHGGNVDLKRLVGLDAAHPEHFLFSILRVFGPDATKTDLDAAESHYKQALLSRQHGHNKN